MGTEPDDPLVAFWAEMSHAEMVRTLDLGLKERDKRITELMELTDATDEQAPRERGRPIGSKNKNRRNDPFPVMAPTGALDSGTGEP